MAISLPAAVTRWRPRSDGQHTCTAVSSTAKTVRGRLGMASDATSGRNSGTAPAGTALAVTADGAAAACPPTVAGAAERQPRTGHTDVEQARALGAPVGDHASIVGLPGPA